jgi:hypothetical protein
MKITYTQVGDYLLPDIFLSDPPGAPPLGRYGMMHKEYLREHKPALYGLLLNSERLYPLCREVDEAAAHRLATIENREAAHEIILAELVYI